jgi:hypothetical protein
MVYKCCVCCYRTRKDSAGKKILEELTNIDDDVQKEEKRVMGLSPKDMQVRVA